MHHIFDATIVIDARSGIEDHMPAQRGVRVNDASGHDGAARGYFRTTAYACLWVNRGGELPALLFEQDGNCGPAGIVSNSDDGVAKSRGKQRCKRGTGAQYRIAEKAATLALQAVIEHPRYLILGLAFDHVDYHLGVTARTENHQLLRFIQPVSPRVPR